MTTPAAARNDQTGRRVYPIPHPDTGEVVDYPSITRVIDVLDKPALGTWKMKMVARGMSERPDLVALAGQDEYQAAKQAIDAAKASEGANLGTALHGYSDDYDRGTYDPTRAPDVVRDRMAMYAELVAELGITPIEIEASVVNFSVGYAGTLDRIVTADRIPRPTVLDLKTGKGVYREVAMQLAAIANAEWIWDARAGQLRPLPEHLRKDKGLVVHLLKTKCHLVPVDIEHAWRMFRAACALWHWRNRGEDPIGKPLHTIDAKAVGLPAPVAPTPAADPFAEARGEDPDPPKQSLVDFARGLPPLTGRYPAEHPRCVELRRRGGALPADLRARIEARFARDPGVSSLRTDKTDDELATIDGWLTDAEDVWRVRHAQIASMAGQCGDNWPAVRAEIGAEGSETTWTATQADLAHRLTIALADDLLTVVDGRLACADGAVAALLAKTPGRRQLLDLARTAVEEIGLDVRFRSADDIATVPAVVAWLAA